MVANKKVPSLPNFASRGKASFSMHNKDLKPLKFEMFKNICSKNWVTYDQCFLDRSKWVIVPALDFHCRRNFRERSDDDPFQTELTSGIMTR